MASQTTGIHFYVQSISNPLFQANTDKAWLWIDQSHTYIHHTASHPIRHAHTHTYVHTADTHTHTHTITPTHKDWQHVPITLVTSIINKRYAYSSTHTCALPACPPACLYVCLSVCLSLYTLPHNTGVIKPS